MLKKNEYSFEQSLFVFLLPSIVLFISFLILIHHQHKTGVGQLTEITKKWLNTYGESFLVDIQIGNTLAVRKKMKSLTGSNFFASARLKYGESVIEINEDEARHTRPAPAYHFLIGWLDLPEKISIDVRDVYGTRWGTLDVSLNAGFLCGQSLLSYIIFFVLGSSVFVFNVGLILFFIDFQSDQMKKVIDYIGKFSKKDMIPSELQPLSQETTRVRVKELQELIDAYKMAMRNIIRLEDSVRAQEIQAHIGTIARQVAHDIRSPLSALNMLLSLLNQVDEEKRVLLRNAVQRINDIANNLLNRNAGQIRSAGESDLRAHHETRGLSLELVPALVDSLLSEKRIQYREVTGLEITGDFKDSYGAFVKINSAEFKRAISNLINNSVEAMPKSGGNIAVSLRKQKNALKLQIVDNGKGMPQEIVNKLGHEGFSYGKDEGAQGSGSGLGFVHANETVKSCGGSLSIQSKENVGTTVTIALPLCTAPPWFVDKIILNRGQQLVVVDDDASIHDIWRSRISAVTIEVNHLAVEIINFSSIDGFRGWHQNSTKKLGQSTYLIDYEFLNQKKNGLDLIEEFGLSANAILVTSRYEESDVRHRAEALRVRLIPKGMAAFVPIEMVRDA